MKLNEYSDQQLIEEIKRRFSSAVVYAIKEFHPDGDKENWFEYHGNEFAWPEMVRQICAELKDEEDEDEDEDD